MGVYEDFRIRILLSLSLFFLIIAVIISFYGLQFEERHVLKIDKTNLSIWNKFDYKKLLIDLSKTYSKYGLQNRGMNNCKVKILCYAHLSGCIAFFIILILLILMSVEYFIPNWG
ncbi:hypothetical protein HNP97_001063 [Methanococcus maripaludis]|uniref:Uncharacterized protein n=2 Tax=Methanococcus maripaludis TaxID=39152 RepID=A0A7J9RZY4_METMI|nr:hypothetical protein [Methanococcus maripaludis]